MSRPFFAAALLMGEALKEIGLPTEITLDAIAFQQLEIELKRSVETIETVGSRWSQIRRRPFMTVSGLTVWCSR